MRAREAADHYAMLGVTPAATQADITRAYRRQLRQLHPDTRTPTPDSARAAVPARPSAERSAAEPSTVGGTVAEALQQVLAAYGVLGDPVRRAAYDRRRPPRRLPPRRHDQTRSTLDAPGDTGDGGGYLRAVPPEPPLVAGPVRYRPTRPRPREGR